MFKLRALMSCLGCCALAIAPKAFADSNSGLSIRTYGTVGYSKLLSKKEKAANGSTTYTFDNVTGVSKVGSFARDTRFGLNIQAPLTDNVTGVIQLNAEGADQVFGTRKDFNVKSTLLFLRFELLDHLKLLVGQTFIPVWMISEEQSIGLTYSWVRPPEEIYAVASPQGMIGGRLLYEIPVGDFSFKPQLTYGDMQYANQITSTTFADAPLRITAFNLEVEHPNLLARFVYGQGAGAEAHVSSIKSQEVEVASGVTMPAEVKLTGISNPVATFAGAGAKFMYDDAFLSSEYAWRKIAYRGTSGLRNAFVNATDIAKGFQVTLGYTFGAFTPIVAYANEHSTHVYSQDGRDRVKALATNFADTDSTVQASISSNTDAYMASAAGQKTLSDTMDAAAEAEAKKQTGSTDANVIAAAKSQIAASQTFKNTVTAQVKAGVKDNVRLAAIDTVNTQMAAKLLAPQDTDQHSIILGVNYAISDNMVLKFQYQMTTVGDGDSIAHGTTTLPRGAQAQMLNTALEFVY